MTWRVFCFAALRDQAGRAELSIDLPAGATALDLKRAAESLMPALAGRMASVRVAADFEFLRDDEALPEGAELALIPPVSGGAPGAGADFVRLIPGPIGHDEVVAAVRGPDAGAIVTFTGTVRAESRGAAVERLEYEVYAAMALDRLRRLAAAARSEHGAIRVAIAHRTGIVPVGEDSLVIAVAARHRAEGFAACRFLIEGLKADVPIWKKEILTDGVVWVGWGS